MVGAVGVGVHGGGVWVLVWKVVRTNMFVLCLCCGLFLCSDRSVCACVRVSFPFFELAASLLLLAPRVWVSNSPSLLILYIFIYRRTCSSSPLPPSLPPSHPLSPQTDLLIILSSQEAVNAFSSLAQISLGTELGIALGPLGRTAATDLHYSSSSSSSGGGTVGAGFCYAE